ncbi:MAG TPA: STAS domain-containing protein [Acidobacteriota bacterium]|nr:STAS domain-containing protein [Acidobacteriota bacterium]
MSLKVTVEKSGQGAFKVRPAGSIDAKTYTTLLTDVEAILAKHPSLLIFDMADVSFVSSAGVGVVLTAEKSMKAEGNRVLMVNAQPHIRKVFDIVQALPPQQIFSSVQEMDHYLKEIQRKVKSGEM